MEHSKLVVIQSYGTRVEADIALGVLESSGIKAMIQADTAGQMRPHLAWGALGFRVLVREEDVETANEVLQPPAEADEIVVQIFGTQDEADGALGALLSAGIPASIRDDSAATWRPDQVWTGLGFCLQVSQEDLAAARTVLGLPPEETGAKN